MHAPRAHTVLAFLGLIALAGCQDLVGTDGRLTSDEVAQLSEAMVASTFETSSEVATSDASLTGNAAASVEAAPVTSTTEFVRTRSCELGGRVVVEGTRERVWDRAEGTGSMTLEMTRAHEECAHPLRRASGGADVTITLNGEVEVRAYHEWVMGERHGLQTMTMLGEVSWETSDDRSGTCVIDIAASFDPETRTRTVTGTFCDREIDRTTTWHHGGMGDG